MACACGKYRFAECAWPRLAVCPNSVAVAVYDQLYPFTREDTTNSDHIWDLFHHDVEGVFHFPRPDDFYAHGDRKVAWVQAHRQELQPLLDWWTAQVSKDKTSSEVSYEREQRSAVG